MNTIDETTQQPLTRRGTLKKALALGALGLMAAAGNDQAQAALSRRGTRFSGRRRRDTRTRDRHERHERHPRISARYDAATSSVIINGSKFSENVRVDITIDYASPFLDYSSWTLQTATALQYTNNHGTFTKSVHVSPLWLPFGGRVEVVDSATAARVSKNFSGS